MLADSKVVTLVREGFSMDEVRAYKGCSAHDAEELFMWAVGCIDQEARIAAKRQKERDRYPRRKRGRFSEQRAL